MKWLYNLNFNSLDSEVFGVLPSFKHSFSMCVCVHACVCACVYACVHVCVCVCEIRLNQTTLLISAWFTIFNIIVIIIVIVIIIIIIIITIIIITITIIINFFNLDFIYLCHIVLSY